MLGKDIYLDKYRSDLQAEARWLEFGAAFKADSVETLLHRHAIHPGTLLELGSGTGAVIRECQRRGLAKEYIAVDASEDAIAWSRTQSPNIRCIVADITSPNFAISQTAEVVVLSHVLEHLEKPRDFLVSLVERMQFSWLIAEVPLEDLPAARIKNLFRDRTRNAAGHVQFFSQRSYLELIASAGLEVTDSLRYFPVSGEEMLQWQFHNKSLSWGGRLIKRLTQNQLPRLLTPFWTRFYHAHLAALCRVAPSSR